MLTLKQQKFCQSFAEQGNASEAYRMAYNAENMKSHTITQKASRLLAQGNIRATVEARTKEIQGKVQEMHLWSKKNYIETLVSIAKGGADIRSSDRTSAVKELNVMHGYNAPIKNQMVGTDGQPMKMTVNINFIGPNTPP